MQFKKYILFKLSPEEKGFKSLIKLCVYNTPTSKLMISCTQSGPVITKNSCCGLNLYTMLNVKYSLNNCNFITRLNQSTTYNHIRK